MNNFFFNLCIYAVPVYMGWCYILAGFTSGHIVEGIAFGLLIFGTARVFIPGSIGLLSHLQKPAIEK